jgi:hypothetical protein
MPEAVLAAAGPEEEAKGTVVATQPAAVVDERLQKGLQLQQENSRLPAGYQQVSSQITASPARQFDFGR